MSKKGRSQELIERRNRKLLERFVWWYEVQKVRLDETLRILSEEEFFISEQRIWCVVKDAKGLLGSDFVAQVKKPRRQVPKGVPKQVRLVAEYSYPLFPS